MKCLTNMSDFTKMKVSSINNYFTDKIDLFICSSSYERRSLLIPKNISYNNIKNCFICMNEDLEVLVGRNSLLISSFFTKSTLVKLSTKSPLITADNFIKNFTKVISKKPMHVVVDMTTFTHESLLIVIKVLALYRDKISKIQFLYNPARDYSINSKTISGKWLSKGIKNIRTVLGYPGKFNPSNKLHFIVILGYEPERTQQLIDKYEPELLTLGFGSKKESINSRLFQINKEKLKKFTNIYKDVDIFEISCINPILTKKRIQEQIDKYPNYNVVIAPMNNKISTLGASLLAIEMPEIQICYSSPNIYNVDGYSKASPDCILCDMTDYWHQLDSKFHQ